jgi:hypothetical protein
VDNLNGSGNIKLFGFSGDALFQNVTITGAEAITAQNDRPDNAIEITGYVNNGNANPVGDRRAGHRLGGLRRRHGDRLLPQEPRRGVPLHRHRRPRHRRRERRPRPQRREISNWGPLFNLDGIEDAAVDVSGFEITFPDGASIVDRDPGATPRTRTRPGRRSSGRRPTTP